MVLLLLLLLHPASSLDYYISASFGNDSNPGTLSSPFQTLGRGISALSSQCSGAPCPATALYLREGEYTVPTPLNLANVAAAPLEWINITSYANETARILGTLDILFSTPSPSDPILSRFLPSVVGKVLVGTIENAPPQGELIYQDRPQVPARWPDDFVALSWATGDPSIELNHSKGCVNPPEEPFLCAGWARTNYTWDWSWGSVGVSNATPFLQWHTGFTLHGLFTYEWSNGASTVSGVYPNGTVEFTRETWTNDGYWGGARYFATNAPEALSQPGEYYMHTPPNSTTTSVYWIPPPTTSTASLPVALSFSSTPTLLTLLNVSRVSITNLEFIGSTFSTLVVANSSAVQVCNNFFSASSYASVDAHTNSPNTNTGVVVSANIITHPGWVGVWLDGGNATTLTSSNSSVSHNLVLNFGRDGFVFNPAIGTDNVGATQSHNLVAGGPACGLMFSGALQTLEFNIVVDSLRSTLDMGVVCTGPRDWTVAGVQIQYNALIANGFTPILSNHVSDPLRNGLYLDYGNLGHSVTGNVMYQPPHPDTPPPSSVPRSLPTRAWGVYNHGGRDMPVRNNIFVGINGSEGNAGGLDGGDKAQLTNGSHYFVSLEGCGGWEEGGWRRPPCSTLLPPSLPLLDGFAWGSMEGCIVNSATCGAAPYGNYFERNVVDTLTPGGAATSSDPRVPMNVGLNLVNQDPMWEAGGDYAAVLDFQLAPGSPAYTTLGGFQRIPMELWGPGWLGEGEWREVLFQFVPWAVGQGKGVGVEVEGRSGGSNTNTTRALRDLINRVVTRREE